MGGKEGVQGRRSRPHQLDGLLEENGPMWGVFHASPVSDIRRDVKGERRDVSPPVAPLACYGREKGLVSETTLPRHFGLVLTSFQFGGE